MEVLYSVTIGTEHNALFGLFFDCFKVEAPSQEIGYLCFFITKVMKLQSSKIIEAAMLTL